MTLNSVPEDAVLNGNKANPITAWAGVLTHNEYAAAMSNSTSGFRYGPYITPVIVRGARVQCAIAGIVKIAGLSNRPLPWPISEYGELIVYKGLATALRKESLDAVSAHWGVSAEKLRQWRDMLPKQDVRQQRRQVPSAGRKFRQGYGWRPEEDEIAMSGQPAETVGILSRSQNAITIRRKRLRAAERRPAT